MVIRAANWYDASQLMICLGIGCWDKGTFLSALFSAPAFLLAIEPVFPGFGRQHVGAHDAGNGSVERA